MTITADQLRDLVEAELSAVSDRRVLEHIQSLLVAPEPIMRAWDYGSDGEAYPCWTVLNHERSNTGIAYCESGFGPRAPWGLVFLGGSEPLSIGMDSAWFKRFLQAYFESKASTELATWRVFRQDEGSSYPGVPVTEEASWDTTWQHVESLRAAHPDHRYHCEQSVYP